MSIGFLLVVISVYKSMYLDSYIYLLSMLYTCELLIYYISIFVCGLCRVFVCTEPLVDLGHQSSHCLADSNVQ